jgi:hypothetical protein
MGCRRDEPETPYEYASKLGPYISQAEAELHGLTEVFVETRYSTHAVDRKREERARADWRGIRAALKRLRHKAETHKEVNG